MRQPQVRTRVHGEAEGIIQSYSSSHACCSFFERNRDTCKNRRINGNVTEYTICVPIIALVFQDTQHLFKTQRKREYDVCATLRIKF